MRKLTLTLCGLLVAGTCFGASIRENCGCGLGTHLMGDQESTLVNNVLVTLLNGLSANQTFGITSGTLGCDKPGEMAANDRLHRYVSDNLDHLVVDVARGYGDRLDSLADLMEIRPDERPLVYARLQSHFGDIFNAPDLTADDVLRNLDRVLQS